MNGIKRFWEKLFIRLSILYIDFVYKTSKIDIKGYPELLHNENNEKFVLGFWHGESYCFFPVLKGSKLYVITTKNRRGDYIAKISSHFGYSPIRVPDDPATGNFLIKIRKQINGAEGGNVAITLDGPLGPYHVPKDFPYITALVSKRRMIPVSINVSRKKQLLNRWDRYVIPFPFNKIEIHFHEPMTIAKGELDFAKQKTTEFMEK